MTAGFQPSARNNYLDAHIDLLLRSFVHWTGRPLLEWHQQAEVVSYLFYAPFVVVSHNADPDPIFTYGNRTALELFELSWEEFTALPSRQSAEPLHQAEREQVLATVAQQGYIEGYQGIRIARSGRRFLIRNVTLWNLLDPDGAYCGQAALYKDWIFLQ